MHYKKRLKTFFYTFLTPGQITHCDLDEEAKRDMGANFSWSPACKKLICRRQNSIRNINNSLKYISFKDSKMKYTYLWQHGSYKSLLYMFRMIWSMNNIENFICNNIILKVSFLTIIIIMYYYIFEKYITEKAFSIGSCLKLI